jgi:hypothetical protein
MLRRLLLPLAAILACNATAPVASTCLAGEAPAKQKNGAWKFTRWDLVDLVQFKVKLKTEFQGSNHDVYLPEAIVARRAK